MQKRTTIAIALGIGMLAVIVPLLAALYLAQRQGMEREARDALTIANGVVRRGDLIGARANEAIDRLRAAFANDPCSDAAIALMRDLSLDSGYLRVLGYVEKGRLMCSTLGTDGKGLVLGPVAHVTSRGTKVRRSVDLGFASDVRFLALEKEGFVALVHPGVAVGVVDRPDTAMGLFTLSNGRQIVGRGAFRSTWPPRLLDAPEVSFSDGDYVVGIARSRDFDAGAYAAIPTAYLDVRVRSLAAILLPMGFMLGAGMSMAILYLARQQMSLPALLRAALKKQAFALAYQPIVELASGRMVGAEALLRWPRPGGGDTLRPDLFIPVAEDCGLIQQFTEFVLARIAVEAPRFLESHPDCYISVNLSAADLHSDGIVAQLAALIASPGIQAHNVLAEVTEHSFVDPERAKQIVTEIRALGIRVAIDDFGTGFSSLSHLAALKLDYLKIDKVFVEAVATGSAASEVALHIIRIAQSLGLTIIAEGVETEVQATFLREHGVACGQGWLFGEARPMAQLIGWQTR